MITIPKDLIGMIVRKLFMFNILPGMVMTVYKSNKKMEDMKKSELTFYKVLIGVVYVVLAVLVIVAFLL